MTTVTPTGQVVPHADRAGILVAEDRCRDRSTDAWASITEPDRLARWFCTWTRASRRSGPPSR